MAITIKPNGEAEVTNNTNQQPVNQQQTGATAPDANGGVNTNNNQTATTTTGTQPQTQPQTQPANPGNGFDFSTVNPNYEGKYDAQLADLYNQITQRKPFEYKAEEDELYQQYVDRYVQGGRLAMEDTMGQAAALTGGYGSSYGQRVGQQTYDEYLKGLNDKAMEMEQIAYGRYQDEGDRLLQQYGMLGDLAADDYAKWSDQYGRAMTEAEMRAQYGDFAPMGQLYGDDAAKRMQAIYGATTLMPLYQQGLISPEDYYAIVGQWPVGYDPATAGAMAAGGGGGGASRWDGGINPYSPRESAYARGVGAEYKAALAQGKTPAQAYKAATGDRYTGSGGHRK